MHASSLKNMERFVSKYMDAGKPYHILDVGSQEVPGQSESYRRLFEKPGWRYEGADVVPGNNVNIVLEHPYRWKSIGTGNFDCVVCGQMLEHDEFFWLTMLEIERILCEGGLCCIIAPSGGVEHRYPVDCYRYYPDGMRALARYAGLEVLEAYAQWNEELYPEMDHTWRDCVLICRKPARSFAGRCMRRLRSGLIYMGSKSAADVQYGNDYGQEETTWRMPKPAVVGSLYIDAGEGFGEENVLHPAVLSGKPFHKSFSLSDVSALRFDPVEGYSCVVKDFRVNLKDGTEVSFAPLNGRSSDDLILFLETKDPQIAIYPPRGDVEIEISAIIYALFD